MTVSDRGVSAFGVVEDFDIFEDCLGQLSSCGPPVWVEVFELEGGEEPFRHGIVQSVIDGPHRAQQAGGS